MYSFLIPHYFVQAKFFAWLQSLKFSLRAYSINVDITYLGILCPHFRATCVTGRSTKFYILYCGLLSLTCPICFPRTKHGAIYILRDELTLLRAGSYPSHSSFVHELII